VKNKLIRLVEIIQEGCPVNLMEAFKSPKPPSLAEKLALLDEAITFHRGRAETLWLKAGKKRTATERRATAQAELAAFVFAYLTGDAKEYADTIVEVMRSLGRQGEDDIVRTLISRGAR
jgi:hypothetical protein